MGSKNLILINQGGNGTSYEAIDQPGVGITVADINCEEGLVDIIVGGRSRLDTYFFIYAH